MYKSTRVYQSTEFYQSIYQSIALSEYQSTQSLPSIPEYSSCRVPYLVVSLHLYTSICQSYHQSLPETLCHYPKCPKLS
ncbi:Orf17 [Heliothis zea nudivirus]|uniref:Orf17 n=1 Tax=Heliothis zea nudivirus 1 TaxID=3116536 RepID=Q8JKU4_9VIRU|nr:Orf17 [Heliothis zea nudivirus]AAN04312.1 Orf17 [Heliothis zea nudivirus]